MEYPSATTTTVTRKQLHDSTLHTITVLNIEGLLPYKFKGKVKLLAEMAQVENALILSLTESHLTQNIREAEINITNYTSFRTDRSGSRKKGVL